MLVKTMAEVLSACRLLADSTLLTNAEKELVDEVLPLDESLLSAIECEIMSGGDPLGSAYMRIEAKSDLRKHGETYTPLSIVASMVSSFTQAKEYDRIIDCGCGSGRFAIECAKAFPESSVYGVDSSPLATLIAKTNVSVLGLEKRVEVINEDFLRSSRFDDAYKGSTLWIGNPPYVRHHDIDSKTKEWLLATAKKLDLSASRLSGLHVYFIAAIARRIKSGDEAVLITSAEWLDTKYGEFLRQLLTEKKRLSCMHLLDRSKSNFKGVATTSLIACFDDNSEKDTVELGTTLKRGDESSWSEDINRIRNEKKWSNLFILPERKKIPSGFVELGDYARVHRGIVTGANKFWVGRFDNAPESLTIPVVSHAREIMNIGGRLDKCDGLSRLLVLPQDLEQLNSEERKFADRVLLEGLEKNIHQGYVAAARKCWWSIRPSKPASILMTYMARKSPSFVANPYKVRALNVVHGIYPQESLSENAVARLVDFLNENVEVNAGRTYCGGLSKFEPRDVEGIWVPSIKQLEDNQWHL